MKCRNALGLDFTALTHLCFSVALYMYILALYITCYHWFLRSIWQNSHRYFFKTFKSQYTCTPYHLFTHTPLSIKRMLFILRIFWYSGILAGNELFKTISALHDFNIWVYCMYYIYIHVNKHTSIIVFYIYI